ncbi:MAG TPA: FtsQ-type POTRA domain-containing protein [Candidatus Binatia bacterium]
MQLAVSRKDNRKKDKFQWRRRLMVAGIMIMFVVAAWTVYGWREQVGLASVAVRRFIFENPYFAVGEIQVRGSDKVRGNEIISMAGLRHGINLWSIDPAKIEKKVSQHPWVRRVLVRREFPRRVVIEVEERRPKAIVAVGKLYYVDADGVLFKEVAQGENVGFPMLTGIRTEELGSFDPAVRRRIQDALRLGDLMAKDSHALSEIHFDAPDRLVVYTIAHPVAIHMGWGDWEGKLQRLDRVMTLWRGKEERLGSLDISFQDRVVTRLRRQPQ